MIRSLRQGVKLAARIFHPAILCDLILLCVKFPVTSTNNEKAFIPYFISRVWFRASLRNQYHRAYAEKTDVLQLKNNT